MRPFLIALLMTLATRAAAYGCAVGKGNAAQRAIKTLGLV
jgi:F0F1-type ATP synthase membrane subunit c/vacuolar-type H+-ATPase subunit K